MPTRPAADTTGRVRLLLVDRDPDAAKETGETLRDSLGGSLAVEHSPSGKPAADLLRRNAYDIVFIDLSSVSDLTPKMEDAVLRLARLADGALIVATAEAQSVSATVAAMRAGAHDAVAKPINGPALASRLRELAQRHGKARALTIETATTSPHADRLASFLGVSSEMQFIYEQIAALVTRDRPGSVPELQRLVQLLAASCDPGETTVGMIAATGANDTVPRSRTVPAPRGEPVLPMWRQEQRIIEDAIARCAGNVALAAAALELSPSTIYRKRQAWAELEGKRGAA